MDHNTPRTPSTPTLRIDGVAADMTQYLDLDQTRRHLWVNPAWFAKVSAVGRVEYDTTVRAWDGSSLTVHPDGRCTARAAFDLATVEVTAEDPAWVFALLFAMNAELEDRQHFHPYHTVFPDVTSVHAR